MDKGMTGHGNRGFGLLVIVMIILGLSLTAGTMVVSGYFLQDTTNIKTTQAKLKKIGLAISTGYGPVPGYERHYENDVGALPTSLNDLITQPGGVAACGYSGSSQTLSGWCGPYWQTSYSGELPFVDSWGRNLVYDSTNRRVYSIGPNGVDDGGAGDDIVQFF